MERRGTREPQFGKLYREFMQEYEDLQHMEVMTSVLDKETRAKSYLPHHGVLREDHITTKLRVMFNGSQCIRSGESLNTYLLIDANLLSAFADVLLCWRWHRYAFVADIEKMYRQILMHPDERDFQRNLATVARFNDPKDVSALTPGHLLIGTPLLAVLESSLAETNDNTLTVASFPENARLLLTTVLARISSRTGVQTKVAQSNLGP